MRPQTATAWARPSRRALSSTLAARGPLVRSIQDEYNFLMSGWICLRAAVGVVIVAATVAFVEATPSSIEPVEPVSPERRTAAVAALAARPLAFERNDGQTDSRARFVAR